MRLDLSAATFCGKMLFTEKKLFSVVISLLNYYIATPMPGIPIMVSYKRPRFDKTPSAEKSPPPKVCRYSHDC